MLNLQLDYVYSIYCVKVSSIVFFIICDEQFVKM